MKILVISDVHSNIHALQAIEAQEKSWDVPHPGIFRLAGAIPFGGWQGNTGAGKRGI